MIDLQFLRKFTKENPSKMRRYIQLYLDVAPECFDKMQSNINDEDWTQLRVNAHSLKPQAEFMGALDLKQTLVKIEEAVDANDTEGARNLYASALRLHSESFEALKEALDGLGE